MLLPKPRSERFEIYMNKIKKLCGFLYMIAILILVSLFIFQTRNFKHELDSKFLILEKSFSDMGLFLQIINKNILALNCTR